MFGFLQHSEEDKTFIFPGTDGDATASNDWSIWTKPSDIKFVRIFCLGGGGGAACRSAASSGGGGSGAVMVVTYPAAFLPDTLFVQAGRAGPGATSPGVNGGTGGSSFVCTYPNTTVAIYRLAYSAGGNASLAASTAGGTLASTTSVSSAPLITNGLYSARGGVTGASAGATTGTNAAGISVAITTGGGGGGTTGKGGDINASDANPLIAGTPAGGSTQGGHGVWFWKTLRGVGGAGGNNTAAGGHAAYGSGGGGSGSTRNGGNGGAGLVIISCW